MEIIKALVLACLLAAPGSAAVSSGIMLLPRGTVEVRVSGQNDWQSVTAKTMLAPGQDVRTQGGSSAAIVFSDGSRIDLSPNSLFTVEKAEPKETLFNLQLGKIKAYFSGIFSSRMNIRTPTSVCSVRGTVFDIDVARDKTAVNVTEGHLEVQDAKGNAAVVTAEETVNIGSSGMEKPRLVSLSDSRAQDAVRPMAVRMAMARDQTRAMIEEMRNRELKANEAQLGKDAIDAFGHRVRIEEYILRPSPNEFKFLFLSLRKDSLNWGRFREVFKSAIPDDLTQLPAIVSASFFSTTAPKNWLKYMEVYLTNTTDAIQESVTFGDPVAVNFSGFGANVGTRYYPSSIDYTQVLSGPGVPGGQRTQFELAEDYNLTTPGQFTVEQNVVDINGQLSTLQLFTMDPSNAANVASGGTSVIDHTCAGGYSLCANIDPATVTSFPSGLGKADLLTSTTYRDGSTVSAEKLLVDQQGNILDFSQPTSNSFLNTGSYNLEDVVTSSLFQGRKIDVLIAPEIFAQKKPGTTAANSQSFNP